MKISDEKIYLNKEITPIITRQLRITHVVHIPEEGFENIKKLKDLQVLELVYTTVGESFLQQISQKLTMLTTLSLRRCNEVNDAGLAHLTNLKSLTSLDLSGCENVTEAGM